MPKKSSTIHIEESFWDLIDDYQTKYKMSSRNTAIECILSEYRCLKNLTLAPLEQISSDKSAINTEKDENKKEDNPMFEKLQQIEDDMIED